MKILLFTILLFNLSANAQVKITGTVFDVTKVNYVSYVRVESSSGKVATTDTLGKYEIEVFENDSLTFFYNNKPTQKFSVAQIINPNQFDISIHVQVNGKYKMMKEVTVFSKSYALDSIENRMAYQKHKLKDKLEVFDPELTEWENMQLNNFDRIFDVGTKTYKCTIE